MPTDVLLEGVVERLSGRHKSDATRVYRSIVTKIRAKAFAPGERLPNERALALEHGVSRNSIRNALSMLQTQGIVTRRMGSGTYLANKAIARLLEDKPVAQHHDAVPTFVELLEGRLLFEPEMMGLAAKRADEADFRAMHEQLRKMQEAREWIEFKECLYGVHLTFYRATKNRFLTQIFESIIANRRAVDYDGGSEAHAQVGELVREQSVRELKGIIDAVVKRDGKLAIRKAREYFVRILSSLAVYG